MPPYRYCVSCQRNVMTEHSWNTAALILLFLMGVLPSLVYAAMYWKCRCPICHTPESMLVNPIQPGMPIVIVPKQP